MYLHLEMMNGLLETGREKIKLPNLIISNRKHLGANEMQEPEMED